MVTMMAKGFPKSAGSRRRRKRRRRRRSRRPKVMFEVWTVDSGHGSSDSVLGYVKALVLLYAK